MDRPKDSRHFQHVYPTSVTLGSGRDKVTRPLMAMRLAERAGALSDRALFVNTGSIPRLWLANGTNQQRVSQSHGLM